MTVVVAQAQRGPGLIDTGDQPIAAVLGAPAQPATLYTMTALMTAADLQDATLQIPFALYLDGALMRADVWTGGVPDRHGTFNPPTFSYSPGDAVPTTVRLTATLPKRLPFGLDVSSTPAR